MTKQRLRTGVDLLDRELDGGIPMGTVTAITATPASQSELFLYEFAATRETVYLATLRGASTVDRVFDSRGVDADGVDTHRVGGDDPVASATAALPQLPAGVNVVVDPVDVLERGDGAAYRAFLEELQEQVVGTDRIAFLHCLDGDPVPPLRRDTVHVADLVFELATEVRGDALVNKLSVPKFRLGRAMNDVVKLDLSDDVEVDMTRNIL